MIGATLKSVLARKLRLVLSGMAVVLGVMFVAGSFVLTDTLGRSYDGLFSDVYADTQVRVAAKPILPEAIDDSGVTIPVPADLVQRVAAVPGVASATGLVSEDGARMVGANGKVVSAFGMRRVGTNWTGETGLTRLRAGHGPQRADEIAVSAQLARAGEVNVGDSVEVLTLQPRRPFTVVGILEYGGDRDSIGGMLEIAFHESVAAELMLGRAGVFSAVDVKAEPGVTPAALRDRVRGALGGDYDIRAGAEMSRVQAASTEEDLAFYNQILLGFAGVALFVGVFLILNTFSIIVAQRTRELALMRALGAGRRQVIGSVLLEAALIGVVASTVGLGLGVGVGAVLVRVFNNLGGGALDVSGVSVPAVAVYASYGVGIVVTLTAALLPAVRASRIPPIAALHEAATPDRPLTRLTVAGVVVGGAGCTLLALGLASGLDELPVEAVLGGILVSLIGIALLTPALARPAVRAIGQVFSWSIAGKLGRLNAARNPRRTAITAAALMIGIAIVTGVNIVFTSTTVSLAGTAGKQLNEDLIIVGEEGSDRPARFDRAVLDRVRAIPGVEEVVGKYYDRAKVGGNLTGLVAVDDVPGWAAMVTAKPAAGSLSPGPDQVVVDEDTAAEQGVRVGSPVRFLFGSGRGRTMTVSGIYTSDWSGGWILPDSAVGQLSVPQPSEAGVQLAPDASVDEIRRQIAALLADNPEIIVTDVAGLAELATSVFDTILLVIQALLALAMLIAVLGIVNTLALSALERTRELGLIRAVGLGRARLVRMITVESMVISIFGALLGLAVGTGLGAVVVKALASEGVTQLALPWRFMGAYLLVGAAIGVVAAVVPAMRAARIDVLQAISYE